MASEIRVNTINNRSGLGTITISDTGAVFAGVTTITSLQVTGTLIGVANTDNIRTNTNATFLQNVNVSGAVTSTGMIVTGVTTVAAGSTSAPSISPSGDSNTGIFFPSADTIAFAEGGAEAARFDSSGRLGIGTNSPNSPLDVVGGSNRSIQFGSSTRKLYAYSDSGGVSLLTGDNQDGTGLYFDQGGSTLRFSAGSSYSEKARITSSGQLLVGTSTSASAGDSQYAKLQVQGNTFLATGNAILNLQRGQVATAFGVNNTLGTLLFSDSTGGEFARIDCQSDAASGTNDYPGRLTFSTTADGASSPTERMRIHNTGAVLIAKTAYADLGTAGVQIWGSNEPGATFITRDSGTPVSINRLTNDGNLIEFYQATTLEGTISVSGTTVSYNGAHLSRWSQLPSDEERTEILRGSVLSNIDEMCEWGEEENEQLNRMKVSDVEGDKNVSGVFQCWDDDDDTYTNDFYCAMTGDFIIRIAEGVTVERGDLLMSAGDGTAKPQDDDIIRSKTIAKVTSTNVSCTYDDGSYCVPCVLMAC